jgi:hypothetical protein
MHATSEEFQRQMGSRPSGSLQMKTRMLEPEVARFRFHQWRLGRSKDMINFDPRPKTLLIQQGAAF